MAAGGAQPAEIVGEQDERAPRDGHRWVRAIIPLLVTILVGGLLTLSRAVAAPPDTAGELASIAAESSSRSDVPRVRLPADRSPLRSPAPIPKPTTPPRSPRSAVPTAAPSTAAPTTAVPTIPRHEMVGREALDLIDQRWQEQLAGWTIEFHPGRAGLLGGTWTSEARIELYIRDTHTVDEVAFTLAHELAHALDVTTLESEDRSRWLEVRGLDPDHIWWVEGGQSDFASGAGDFAESFAVWQVGGPSKSQLGGSPAAAEIALLEEMLAG